MTDAHARLLAARDVLNRAERAVGLRARDDIEHGSTGASPILLGPTSRSELIRLLIDVCPTGGWIGVCGVLVLTAEKDSPLVDLCALLVDACDVICLDIPELSGAHQRILAARARSMGRTIVTLSSWQGLSRVPAPRPRMRLVI